MTTLDEQFEDLYGPMPQFSDYKRGDHITYRSGGQILTGTILWMSGPEVIAEKQYPTCYIVECDTQSGVRLGDVVIQG